PFLWLAGKIVKTVAPTLGLRWVGILIQYLGMTTIGPSFLIFCLTFFFHRRIRPVLVVFAYLPALIIYILIATNPVHHLFYTEFTMYRDSFGPVFHATTVLIYSLLAAGTVLLAVDLIKRKRGRRNQIALFIVAAIIPLVASAYYPRIGDLYSGLKFDITPLSFNLSFLCFGIAVFRYDFLDVPRVAYGRILEELPEGIIVTGKSGLPLYANRAGRRFSLSYSVSSPDNTPDGLYRLKRYYLPGKGRLGGITVLSAIDRTDLVARKNRILADTERISRLTEDIRRKVAEEQEILYLSERIRVAQDLHDILGHSLTLLISQLECLKLVDMTVDRSARLGTIHGILESGARELGRLEASGDENAPRPPLVLSRQLQKLSQQCSSDRRRVAVIVRGREVPMESESARNIYSICRESITNSIRHGLATEIAFVLEFGQGLTLLILDNGKGCFAIKDGTGLSGIRARVKGLHAQVSFHSAPGEGFVIRLFMPGC
ncbi:MAG: histidine kinase N-terminal 7TM domain-containing protein, partial [Spirochaetota bacterium]